MSKHVDSVKRVADYLRDLATRNEHKESVVQKLQNYASGLDEAADHLVHLEGITSALPPDLGNIYDLPAELRSELSVAKTDELEDQIVTVINAHGGEASLDQILVGLYRKFSVLQKRRFIQNKLYRMKGTVWGVEGRKGFYTTTAPTQSGANNFAQPEQQSAPPWEEDDIPF